MSMAEDSRERGQVSADLSSRMTQGWIGPDTEGFLGRRAGRAWGGGGSLLGDWPEAEEELGEAIQAGGWTWTGRVERPGADGFVTYLSLYLAGFSVS